MNPSSKGLPGEDLIQQGVKDMARGVESMMSLLVMVGYPRLTRLRKDLPKPLQWIDHPEIRLYQLLSQRNPQGAHSRFNALIRRLVSYERALEHQESRS